MTMTEEEARKKWCPQVRYFVDADGLGRTNMPEDSCRCIASDCMAWRWSYDWIKPHDTTLDEYAALSTTLGYCGLAGSQQ
jgi:hypothetical protein